LKTPARDQSGKKGVTNPKGNNQNGQNDEGVLPESLEEVSPNQGQPSVCTAAGWAGKAQVSSQGAKDNPRDLAAKYPQKKSANPS
jgi:hypothetical protein